MIIGIFTDPHFSSAPLTCGVRRNNQSLRKIREALEAFDRAHCALCVCLGDLTDIENSHELEAENLRAIARIFREFSMKTIVLMGNHDADVFGPDEFYRILGEDARPDDLTCDGARLIFLNGNFSSDALPYAPGHIDWTDAFLPDADGLQRKLNALSSGAYLFIHQNIDPAIRADHRLSNADEVFEAILASKKVRAVFQGHYHPGLASIYEGVSFQTLPAMCENESAYFITDI